MLTFSDIHSKFAKKVEKRKKRLVREMLNSPHAKDTFFEKHWKKISGDRDSKSYDFRTVNDNSGIAMEFCNTLCHNLQ